MSSYFCGSGGIPLWFAPDLLGRFDLVVRAAEESALRLWKEGSRITQKVFYGKGTNSLEIVTAQCPPMVVSWSVHAISPIARSGVVLVHPLTPIIGL